MENAADALKIAFAIFVFIIALSIFFSLITKVKDTADSILISSDKTNYYEWTEGTLENGRLVGEDTVIAALYNSSDDLTRVIIQKGGEQIYPSSNRNIREVIEEKLSDGTIYFENIVEVVTGGTYRVGEDGTKITIRPGTTKTYIYYTAQ